MFRFLNMIIFLEKDNYILKDKPTRKKSKNFAYTIDIYAGIYQGLNKSLLYILPELLVAPLPTPVYKRNERSL